MLCNDRDKISSIRFFCHSSNLRVVFSKNRIWSKIKVLQVKNGYFFRILHPILSDYVVSIYFFGPHFNPKVKDIYKPFFILKPKNFMPKNFIFKSFSSGIGLK
jgi:hypothetical protein